MLPCVLPGGLLRRLRPSDLAAFQEYRAIPELARYQGWSPMSDAEALAFLAEMNEAPLFTAGAWVQLGIAEIDSDILVGDVGVFLSDDGLSGEIGFTLAPNAQGRGLATAAVRLALHVFFEATTAERVLGVTDGRNTASIRLLERAGFRYEGRRDTVFRGEPCCEQVYVLSRSDG